MGLVHTGRQTLTTTGMLVAKHDVFLEAKGTLEWCHYMAAIIKAVIARASRLTCTTDAYRHEWGEVFDDEWRDPMFWYPDSEAASDPYGPQHEREVRSQIWKLAHNAVESEQLQLTMTEMLSLFLSQELLLPLAGTQFGDGLQTALQKIRALLPARALTYFEGLDGSFFIKNLANHDYSGQDKEIRILNEAILSQKCVKVIYRSASKGRETISEFHPYGMVLLHASLYCIGYLR